MGRRMLAALTAFTLAVPAYVTATAHRSGAAEPVGGTFNAVPATTVFDTTTGVGGRSTPMATYEIATIPMAGVAGVPASGAAAVAVDVTVINSPGAGHITLWPSGTARPGTSTMNLATGQTLSNFAIVPLGADGAINVYNAIAGGPDIALDVHGWISAVTDTQAPGRFVPVTPSRLVDTRSGVGGRTGSIPAGTSWTLHLGGVGGIATTAGAAALNVTVPSTTSAGSITVHASDVARPSAATLNYPGSTTVATFTMAALSASGDVTFYNSGPSAAHLVVDVMGYLTAGTNTQRGGMFEMLTPVRIHDTRNGTGGRSTPLNANEAWPIAIRGVGGVPTSSSVSGSVMIGITALGSTSSGSFILYASGTTRPTVSTVNFGPTVIRGGFAIVPIGSDGKIVVYNSSGGVVDVLVDILGYITPVTANSAPSAPSALSPPYGSAVSDGTPTLSAYLGDADTDQMTTTWTVQDTVSGAYLVNNVAGRNAASGTTTTYDVAPGLIQNGGSYQWRVAACDGTACTTGPWSTFTASGINSVSVAPDPEYTSDPMTACQNEPEFDPATMSCLGDSDEPSPPRFTANYTAYSGSSYSETPTNQVVVLTDTVLQKPTTLWAAAGMVRNELYQAGADDVVVTAVLKDSAGNTLGSPTTTITEFNLRPGEPAPFTITSSVTAADVASVTWSAAATTVTAPVERQLTSTLWWEQPYAERDPVDLGYYTETAPNPPGPLPHLEFGDVTNVGTTAYTSMRVIGAWLDSAGRVLDVVNVPVVDDTGTPIGLYPGQSGQFLVVANDPATAGVLSDSEFVTWQVGA